MTAGGFLCYAKDIFCLFISIEIRRNVEERGAQYERDGQGRAKEVQPPTRCDFLPLKKGLRSSGVWCCGVFDIRYQSRKSRPAGDIVSPTRAAFSSVVVNIVFR